MARTCDYKRIGKEQDERMLKVISSFPEDILKDHIATHAFELLMSDPAPDGGYYYRDSLLMGKVLDAWVASGDILND